MIFATVIVPALAAAQIAVPPGLVGESDVRANRSDAEICLAMRHLSDRISGSAPVNSGNATILQRLVVVCTIREVNFSRVATHRAVDAQNSAENTEWDAMVCAKPLFATMSRSGWTLSDTVIGVDGREQLRDIDCGHVTAAGLDLSTQD